MVNRDESIAPSSERDKINRFNWPSCIAVDSHIMGTSYDEAKTACGNMDIIKPDSDCFYDVQCANYLQDVSCRKCVDGSCVNIANGTACENKLYDRLCLVDEYSGACSNGRCIRT